MSTSRPGNRDPRYRPSPSSSGGWPVQPRPRPTGPPPPDYLRRLQLAACRRCQWQARAVRCVAEAVDAVWSREDVLRSTCERHLAAWLRTGGRKLS